MPKAMQGASTLHEYEIKPYNALPLVQRRHSSELGHDLRQNIE